MKTTLVALCSALALASFAASASASRPASAAERAAFSKAVIADVKGGFPQTAHFRVFAVRVSTVSKNYARAYVTPYGKGGQQLTDTALVVLHRVSARWRVVDLGTDDVGCALPKPVRRDLLGGVGAGCHSR